MKLNIGGITEAGLSKNNKTGTWRYQIPFIIEDNCNGCGLCEIFCPDSCLTIINKLVSVDTNYCKGCGICAIECNQNAIIMQSEGESSYE